MELTMHGRKALITGGSLGLGRAMGRRFAESGAAVALVARRADVLEDARAEILAAAPQAQVGLFTGDMRHGADVERVYREATDALGPIDILVNNVGTSATGVFEEITDEQWQEDFELKLFSAIRLSRLAFPGMKARRWGRIINVLNTGAKAPGPRMAPTAVTRAAGMALTKVLSGEGAPHNVLVNALCTGAIVSDQWHRHHQREMPDKSFEEYVEAKGKAIPMGRMGQAEEFANMACFLASEQGSYITGTAINVDGGRSPVV